MRVPWSAVFVVTVCAVCALMVAAGELLTAAALAPIAWLRNRVQRAGPLQRAAFSVRGMLDEARLADGPWIRAWLRAVSGFAAAGLPSASTVGRGQDARALVLLPRPPNWGRDGSWVVLERLRQLQRRWSADAIVLVDSSDDRELRELVEVCSSVHPLSRGTRSWRSPRGVAAPERLVRDYSSPRLRRQLARAIVARAADVVILEYAEMAYVARGLLQGMPAVYMCHESLLGAAYEELASGHGGASQERVGRAACFEARILRDTATCVALSRHDAQLLACALRVPPPSVLPSSITLAPTARANPGDRPLALFVGSFSHEPNLDAADWLLHSIWPQVIAAFPEARLAVVGRGAESSRPEPLPPSVIHFGPSEDLEAWLTQAAVVVAPLRGGAGLRGKLLEAWARGKAVVATPLAARGFDVEDGAQCLMADSADEFAAAICACLQDEQLRRRLGEQGLAYARAAHDPVLLAARFADQLDQLKTRAFARCGAR